MILTTKQEEADTAARVAAAEAPMRAEDSDGTTWEETTGSSSVKPSSHEPHNAGRARNAWAYAKKMSVNNAVNISARRLTDGILRESLRAAHALNSTGDVEEISFDMSVALQELMSRRVRDVKMKHGSVARRIESGGLNAACLSKAVWLQEVVSAQSDAVALFDIRDYRKTMFKGRCVAPAHIQATFQRSISHSITQSLPSPIINADSFVLKQRVQKCSS